MEKKFCPSCGENVDTYMVDKPDRKEICCIFCGMIVEGLTARAAQSSGHAIIADDSALIRELLKDTFKGKALAAEVDLCVDGSDFVKSYTRCLRDKKGFSLVVLDVSMPILNGINAAIAMRAVEKGFETRPTPILFFTAQKCDENFQKVLEYCKPAQYINKGVNSTPDQLAARVSHVVEMLLSDTR